MVKQQQRKDTRLSSVKKRKNTTMALLYCDVERDCPQADGDESAGDWATSHDSGHDVLVDKKTNLMLVFILFSTE